MSFTSESRCVALTRMRPICSRILSVTGPEIPSSISSEYPSTAFRGVRSSWDMIARNSDLALLAASASRRASLS